jgi:3-dehydroquinate synthase II
VAHERVLIEPTASSEAARQATVDRARRRGFRGFVLPPGASVAPLAGEEIAVRRADRMEIPGRAEPVPVHGISTLEELERAVSSAVVDGILAVEWPSDRVIPLENAVAAKGSRFRIWTCVRSVAEAPAALGALEHGADRVIVAVGSPDEIDVLEGLLDAAGVPSLDWVEREVRSIRPVGLGDRVLVDTTSLLRADEGLLVGSAAAFLFHVVSEAVGSAFSRPRPFRVNAGSAHSYVLLPDGTTRYLSELGPGDSVLVASPDRGRSVRVGRIKIERRPLVAITVDDAGKDRTVFLQEAETVRLSTAEERVAVTRLAAGAKVRGVRLPSGRHLGVAVEESIEER